MKKFLTVWQDMKMPTRILTIAIIGAIIITAIATGRVDALIRLLQAMMFI